MVKGTPIVIAASQSEFQTVTAVVVNHPGYSSLTIRHDDDRVEHFNTLLVAFQPDDTQRAKLAAGEPLYIGVLTGGAKLQPLLPCVGAAEAAAIYNTEVVE